MYLIEFVLFCFVFIESPRETERGSEMEAERKLSVEAEAIFREGVALVLSRWSALQLAVDNEWGGRDSRRKSEQLAADVFSWFTQSKGTFLNSLTSTPSFVLIAVMKKNGFSDIASLYVLILLRGSLHR